MGFGVVKVEGILVAACVVRTLLRLKAIADEPHDDN